MWIGERRGWPVAAVDLRMRPGAASCCEVGHAARDLVSARTAPADRSQAHVDVIVVVDERPDDRLRAPQAERRADEGDLRAGTHEAVDEVLRPAPVDLPRADGGAQQAVAPRVVDVGVEPVLVRRVTRRSERFSEGAAVRTREVADPEARRSGVGSLVRPYDVAKGRDEPLRPRSAPLAVRRAPPDEVPREEALALGRERDTADEPPVPGKTDSARFLPTRGGEPRCGRAEKDARGYAKRATHGARVPDAAFPCSSERDRGDERSCWAEWPPSHADRRLGQPGARRRSQARSGATWRRPVRALA